MRHEKLSHEDSLKSHVFAKGEGRGWNQLEDFLFGFPETWEGFIWSLKDPLESLLFLIVVTKLPTDAT